MRKRTWLFTILLTVASAASAAKAQDWTRFRGPNGQGVASAADFPAQWSDKDINWRVDVPGVGQASPVIWGERVFVASGSPDTGSRHLLCVSTGGKILWQKDFPAATHHVHTQNSFASSTPAVDEQRVYMAWATPEQYVVLALDHEGTEVWRRDLGGFNSQHGYGTSPVVVGDLLVVTNDQEGESYVLAVDCKTGETRWKSPHRTKTPQNASYSVPCLYEVEGQGPQLIVNCWSNGMTSLDPASGKVNWELEVFERRPVGSPIFAAGLIFGNSGDGGGNNAIVAVKPADKLGERPEVKYTIEKSLSPYVPTLIAKDDLLFAWTDRGIVSCLQAADGKPVWKQRVGGNFSGSPIRVGDKLFCISAEGEVVVVAAGREFKLLGKNSLGEGSRSTPAVSGGVMYLRTESKLISVGGK